MCFQCIVEHFNSRFSISDSTRKCLHACISSWRFSFFFFSTLKNLSVLLFLFQVFVFNVLLTQCVETGKFCTTFLSLMCNFDFRCTVLLEDMLYQVLLGCCWETGTLDTKKCSTWKSVHAPYNVPLCSLCSTFFTSDYLVRMGIGHFNKGWWTR